jgi:hypothetical protein
MTGLGAIILIAICGLSGFFVIVDERRGDGAEASSAVSTTNRTINSRAVDAEPLSVAEVFPGTEIHLTSGDAPYTVAGKHIDGDCGVAATGRVVALLDRYGCSQVVRARLTAPYGGYPVTAGVFNLADETGAVRLAEQLRTLVETGTGGLAAMSADLAPGSAPRFEPLAHVGWQQRGHYLVYCVITAPDGRMVRADDPYAGRITADLLESHLDGQILSPRTR